MTKLNSAQFANSRDFDAAVAAAAKQRCVVCDVPVRERTIDGDAIFIDPDGLRSSESPRFHDHDAA